MSRTGYSYPKFQPYFPSSYLQPTSLELTVKFSVYSRNMLDFHSSWQLCNRPHAKRTWSSGSVSSKTLSCEAAEAATWTPAATPPVVKTLPRAMALRPFDTDRFLPLLGKQAIIKNDDRPRFLPTFPLSILIYLLTAMRGKVNSPEIESICFIKIEKNLVKSISIDIIIYELIFSCIK